MPRAPLIRGLTLVEVLVGAGLGLLVLVLVAQLFVLLSRASHGSLDRASTEQSLTLAMDRLVRDLNSTAPAGVSMNAAGSRLAVHPIRDVDDVGTIFFEDYLVVWIFEGNRLVSYRCPPAVDPGLTFDGRPHRLDPAALDALPVDPSDGLRFTLEPLESFALSNPPGLDPPLVGQPLNLRLEARYRNQQGAEQAMELVRDMALRTSGF